MRRALWAVSLLALISISCADGTDENSADSTAGTTAGGAGGASGGGAGGAGAGGTQGPRCGDGEIDPATETCDPPGATSLRCEDLGMPSTAGSMVACSNSCQLMTYMCGSVVGGMGGGDGAMGGNGG